MSFSTIVNEKFTYLSRPIDLRGCEVSLANLYLPKEVLVSAHRFTVRIIKGDVEEERVLRSVNVWSTFEIVEKLAKALDGFASVETNSAGCLKIICQKGILVALSAGLAALLGFSQPFITDQSTAVRPVLLGYVRDRVSLVTNLIEPYMVNGSFLPCLYHGSPTYQGFFSPYYQTRRTQELQVVKIGFFSAVGEELHIPDGSFSCQLIFRRIP